MQKINIVATGCLPPMGRIAYHSDIEKSHKVIMLCFGCSREEAIEFCGSLPYSAHAIAELAGCGVTQEVMRLVNKVGVSEEEFYQIARMLSDGAKNTACEVMQKSNVIAKN